MARNRAGGRRRRDRSRGGSGSGTPGVLLALLLVGVMILAAFVIFVASQTPPDKPPPPPTAVPFGRVYAIAVDPGDSRKIFLATQHGLVIGWNFTQPSWRYASNDRSDLTGFAMHPRNPLWMFSSGRSVSGSSLGLRESLDAGKSWETVSLAGTASLTALAISPVNPRIMYGWDLASSRLMRSENDGRNWTTMTTPPPGSVFALAAHPLESNTVLAGTPDGMFRSLDGGADWERFGISDPGLAVFALAYSPGNPEILVAGVSGGAVFFTTNGGTTWLATTGQIPAHADAVALAAAADDTGHIFVATSTLRIYETQDGAKSWYAWKLPPK